ncbi:MAG: N-acetylmuramoyl-L-alanine amidase [Burkholderiales bacterium]|jgi:N-acetylmuramoyl-L-alanine amidase|nr:N-acetylmuramoyl-L-alanine amidase [Burkholderiales bacterium]
MTRASAVLLLLITTACAPLPQRTTLLVEQRPSPNYNERRPSYVVLHHSSNDTAERALTTLTTSAREVSAHYLIGRDGTIYYLVDELARAWHAGHSYWAGNTDINSASIGIELDNNGDEPFSDAQITVLLALLADLKARYRIPAANFLGHGDVAPRRKADPSRWFPWKRLADHGYGLWCELPYAPAPPEIDTTVLLGALGYDVSDPAAASAAFQRRFLPHQSEMEIGEAGRALLYCLLHKARS